MKEFDFKKVVTKRVFDTPVSINEFLRKNKNMAMQEIAEKLNLPKTQVEHYFRTDRFRAVPSPEIWMQMKAIMKFDDSLDQLVTSTYQKLMEFDMSQRVYSDQGMSPTIQATEPPLIISKKQQPMIADFRNDEGLRIRKNMLSPTLATRKHSETDISTMPPIIIAPNRKEIDLTNAPMDRPFQITEARTEIGKQSRREIREKEGRDSTLRSKDHKKYVPLNSDIANCLTTGKENIEKWVFENKIEVKEKDFIRKNQYLMGTNGVSQTINAEGFGSFGHTGLYELPESRDIRRLTPVECERLQGFEDNWTQEGMDENGKTMPISDTQRYKVLGNAVTVNVIEAIGRTFCKTIDNPYVSQKEIRVRKTQPLDDWL